MSGLRHFLFYWLLLAVIPTALFTWLGLSVVKCYLFGMLLTVVSYAAIKKATRICPRCGLSW